MQHVSLPLKQNDRKQNEGTLLQVPVHPLRLAADWTKPHKTRKTNKNKLGRPLDWCFDYYSKKKRKLTLDDTHMILSQGKKRWGGFPSRRTKRRTYCSGEILPDSPTTEGNRSASIAIRSSRASSPTEPSLTLRRSCHVERPRQGNASHEESLIRTSVVNGQKLCNTHHTLCLSRTHVRVYPVHTVLTTIFWYEGNKIQYDCTRLLRAVGMTLLYGSYTE